jgi:hypothetical protein
MHGEDAFDGVETTAGHCDRLGWHAVGGEATPGQVCELGHDADHAVDDRAGREGAQVWAEARQQARIRVSGRHVDCARWHRQPGLGTTAHGRHASDPRAPPPVGGDDAALAQGAIRVRDGAGAHLQLAGECADGRERFAGREVAGPYTRLDAAGNRVRRRTCDRIS